MRRLAGIGSFVAGGALVYRLLVRGALTLDLGVGRRVRPLRTMRVQIAAPPGTVFDVVAGPYLRSTPRAMAEKLQVLERGSDMALAAHFTQVGRSSVATTVETVRFERPDRVTFRLVRGPVPHVLETFELREREGGTELEYSGELGTDLWAPGAWWGSLVARSWERAVEQSLAGIRTEAERRAGVRTATSR